jgi:hypothetical protein
MKDTPRDATMEMEETIVRYVLLMMPKCGWLPMAEAAVAMQEQHARGLLKAEERDVLLRNWAFLTMERRFERYHKLGPRDVRHGIAVTGTCRGFEADAMLVDYHVELATEGRGFSAEGFAALKAAEAAVVEWGQAYGLTLPGLALAVEPIVHVAKCAGCGKEAGREAIRATLTLPGGRRLTREYLATMAKAREAGPA